MFQSSPLKKLTGSILPKAGIFYLSVLLIIGTFSITLAAPTKLLNYQARITDPSGESVSDGSYSIVFKIYNVASGGSALWTETNEVTLEDGILDVRLGNSTPINLDFNTGTYYLGVTIEDDSELSPRRPIGAAPFALNSSLLDGRPVGTGPNDVLALDGSSNLNLPNDLDTNGNANVDGNATIDGSLTSSLVNTSFVTLGTSAIGGTNGRIRFTGTDFEGFFGGVWHSLTQTGADLQGSEGQVAFFDDTDTLVGDDNFFFDQTNSRLGIGTNNPTESLDIIGNGKFSGNLRWYSGTGFYGEIDHTNTANRVYTFPNKSGTVAMLDDISIINDHGSLTGLGDDDHSQYALLAGRSSGQILYGGTASGADLTLRSTTNGTKGSVFIVDDGGTVIIGTAGNATLSVPGVGSFSLQIGASTTATMLGALAIGTSANATEIEATAIGFVSLASGHHSTALGARAEATALHSIALGDRSKADEANSLVIGNDFEGGYDTRNVYVGYGRVSSFAPGSSVTFNATGGLGANIDGADLQLAGGRPTGSGNGGEIRFLTAPSGASSSTLQTLITRWIVEEEGHIIPGANDSYDIGSDSSRVRDLYLGAGTLHVGTSTADEGLLRYDTVANELELDINGTNITLFRNDGDVIIGSAGSGNISVPGSGAQSEQFGSNASATGANSVALGSMASAGADGTALGQGALSSGSESIAIGRGATSSALQSISIGHSSDATGSMSISVGYNATASASNSMALGYAAVSAFGESIALGHQAMVTGSNQFVVGSSNAEINSVFFGNGVVNTIPQGSTTITTTGGSGTNVAATNLVLAGGRGTGTGAGGDLLFQTASPGLTGSTLNPLATRLTIDDVGNVVVGTSALTASATDGFLYFPQTTGAPSGTPTAYSGRVPMTWDATGDTLYVYEGGTWHAISGGGGGISGSGSAGQITFWNGATSVTGENDFIWDSANNRLEIIDGVSGVTPHAESNLVIHATGSNGALEFAGPTNAIQAIRFSDTTGSSAGKITYRHTTDALRFQVGGSDVMEFLTGSGLLIKQSGGGLGSEVATRPLEVLDNTEAQLRLSFGASDFTDFLTNSSGELTISPSGSQINVAGSILPTTDNIYDLGSTDLRWQDIYLGPASLNIHSTAAETGTAREWSLSIEQTSGAQQGNLQLILAGTDIVNFEPDGDVVVGQTASGNLSVPGLGTSSEQFGASALASDSGTAVGNSALASVFGVAVGNSTFAGIEGVAIGWDAEITSGGLDGIAIGSQAENAGGSGVAIGRRSTAEIASIAIGPDAFATTNSIAIGQLALNNTAHTAVIGSVVTRVDTLWGGKGSTSPTPTAWGIQGTGGFGTNIAGGSLNISAGQGTGTGAGGSIVLQTASAGASGSTLNALVTRWTIDSTGHLLPGADDTYDIGSNSARVRDLYLGPGSLHVGSANGDEGSIFFDTTNDELNISVDGTTRLLISDTGNIVQGTGALATSATNGFPYIPTTAGVPTGTPTTYSGRAPFVFNTASNTLYFYNGGWQAIGGGGGGITGTGAAGQVTYWTGASAVAGHDDLFWDAGDLQLGIGNTTPRYKLDVATSGSSTQIRFGSSGDDNGGFLTSWTENNAYLAGGAVWESGDWIAKAGSAAILGSGSGPSSTRLRFFVDDGLTPGNTFTPTERMTITETGNVGINDTTPDDFRLQVGGSIGPTTNNNFDLGSDSLRWRDLYLGASGGIDVMTIHLGSSLADEATFEFDTDNDRLEFGVDGTARMVINDQGQVGIGTTDPIAKFAIQNANTSTGLAGLDEISQDTSFAGVLLRSVYEADTNMQGVMWTNSAADNYQNPIAGMWAQQNTGGSELRFGTSNDFSTGVNNFGLVIGNNGQVAVGSSTDTGATFNVWSGGANYGDINDLKTNANNAGIRIQAGADNDTYKPGVFWSLDTDNLDDFEHSRPVGGTWLYQDGTSTNMIFGVSDDPTSGITNVVMIDEDGDLGIGYDTPADFYPLDAKSGGTALGLADSAGNYLVTINPDQSVGGGTFDVIASASDADQLWVGRDTSENPTSTINGAGDANFNTVTETSDQRLKKNISPVLSGLDVVNALNPVTYDFITGKKNQSGFIAQEVQKILPGLVSKKVNGYLSLNYSGIIPYVVKATKELNVQVVSIKNDMDSLKVSIADLKNEVAGLKGEVAGIKDRLSAVENKTTDNKSVFGKNVKLEEGALEFRVELDEDLDNTNYSTSITPNWNTNFWITDKNTSWFKVHFGVAAPKDSSFDYIIVK